MSESDLAPVSVESSDGRILTGVGVTEASLEKTMERHAPDAPEPSTVAADAPDQSQPKPSRGAKRFDQLTAEREEARREAAAAKHERDELARQLAQRAAPVAPASVPSPAVAAPAAAAAPSPTRPKPSESEVGDKYESYADFVEDLADWKSEQRLAALDFDARIRSSIEADRASRSFVEHVDQVKAKAREVYQDFDAVLKKGPGAEISLGQTDAQAVARVETILRSPHAEHLLYAISKDAAIAQQLAQYSDIEFGMALSRFVPPADTSVASPASTGIRRPVVAPAPFTPVSGGSKTSVTSSSELAKKGFDFDRSGYREKRAAERGLKLRSR